MHRHGVALTVVLLVVLAGVAYAAHAEHGTVAQSNAQPDQATAIQQVIQKGDAEQVDAIAKQDESVMSDTSSPTYLQTAQQTNEQLLSGGVTSIALNGIEWGPINVSGTTATAVDYETWTTVYSDSSTEESRDENDYTLMQQNGTWLIQSDAQPNGAGEQRGARLPTPAPATPSPGPGAAPTVPAASRSANWAGYASTSGSFSSISGTWTIPTFSPTSSAGMDATWVGIGGVNSDDLIQAGTQEQTSGSGQTLYSAWVETLPAPSQPVALVVRAGDSVTVALIEQSPGVWQVTATNNTTGQNAQVSCEYRSSHSSAEWIEEAPTAERGGILPIDNFGSVDVSGASSTLNGQQTPLVDSSAQAINLANASGQALVQTSPIGSDGQSFSVTRTDVSDTQPAGRRTAGRGGGAP